MTCLCHYFNNVLFWELILYMIKIGSRIKLENDTPIYKRGPYKQQRIPLKHLILENFVIGCAASAQVIERSFHPAPHQSFVFRISSKFIQICEC